MPKGSVSRFESPPRRIPRTLNCNVESTTGASGARPWLTQDAPASHFCNLFEFSLILAPFQPRFWESSVDFGSPAASILGVFPLLYWILNVSVRASICSCLQEYQYFCHEGSTSAHCMELSFWGIPCICDRFCPRAFVFFLQSCQGGRPKAGPLATRGF